MAQHKDVCTSVPWVLDDRAEGGEQAQVLGPGGDGDVHLPTLVVLCARVCVCVCVGGGGGGLEIE